MNNTDYIYELMKIVDGIPSASRERFAGRFAHEAYNPGLVFGFSVFLGQFGIDRFILGHWVPGILKLITLGGFGLWMLIDWFLVGNAVRRQNIALAHRICQEL